MVGNPTADNHDEQAPKKDMHKTTAPMELQGEVWTDNCRVKSNLGFCNRPMQLHGIGLCIITVVQLGPSTASHVWSHRKGAAAPSPWTGNLDSRRGHSNSRGCLFVSITRAPRNILAS